jgi:hypothetical protein
MNLPYYFTDDLMHLLIVFMSFGVLCISLFAYLQRKSTRYLFLCLAFVFLTLSQTTTAFETFFLSDTLIIIPYVDVHVTHLFDFATLLCFGIALTKS